MILRQSTAAAIFFQLVDSTGAAVPGMVASDFTNGTTPGHVSVVRPDRSIIDITLSGGVNFWEVDATKAPGLYQVLIPSTATAQVGQAILFLLPAASSFVATRHSLQVDGLLLDAERARKCTYNDYEVIEASNTATVYEDDGTTPFKVYDLFDNGGSPTSTNPFKRRGL